MEIDEGAILKDVLLAINQRDKKQARELLTRLLKTSPDVTDYWLWMSCVVETRKERIYCLKEVLRREPQNTIAQRGLILMGAIPGDGRSGIPYELQRKDWEAGFKRFSDFDTFLLSGMWRPAAVVLGFILLAAVLIGGYSVFKHRKQPAEASYANIAQTQELTLISGDTEFTIIPVDGLDQATPLSSFLQATYTPTPLYVNTPHPEIEDYRSAMIAYKEGDWQGVIDRLTQVLKIKPNSIDAYYYIGEANRFLGKYVDARDAYESALRLDPRFGPAYLGRARTLLSESFDRNSQAAREDLVDAIKYDPAMGEAYLELGMLDIRLGEPSRALESLDIAGKYLPGSPQLERSYAQAYLDLDETEMAIQHAQQALAFDMTDTSIYRILGKAYLSMDQAEDAVEPLEIYTLYYPEDLEALFWLGQAYADVGEVEDALTAFTNVLAVKPDDFEALLARGRLYLDIADYENASIDYQAALRLRKDSYEVYIGMAHAVLVLENFRDAAYYAERARAYVGEDNSRLAAYYYFHAQALEGMENYESAISDWNAFLDLPEGSYSEDWADVADEHLQRLAETPTATSTTAGSAQGETPGAPGITLTDTRVPTLTITLTHTRMPTATPPAPTATQTRQPTQTPATTP